MTGAGVAAVSGEYGKNVALKGWRWFFGKA
jgi:hypothetical protein